MTPEEYAAQQALITAGAARYTQQFASLFARVPLDWAQWIQLLNMLFPEIESRRYQAAELARQFYDQQRAEVFPELPRNDRPLEGYTFEWFVQNMEPTRKQMSEMDSRSNAVAHLVLRAVREVENAGRRQLIHAVENDFDLDEFLAEEPDEDPADTFDLSEFLESVGRETRPTPAAKPKSRLVKGWARVATGRETCAWCLMLISRGPIYMAADTAGLDLSDDTAQRMIAAGEDVSGHMQEWHTGCDCKVVPVFKHDEWFGQEAADHALELWNEASREASRLIESGEARSENLNREAINALRRRLSRGEIDPSEFAALAA